MTFKLEIVAVGDSAGVVLPPELLGRLGVGLGDSLLVVNTPNGVELTRFDEEFAEDMAIAEHIMREDRDVLRKLADS